MTNLRSLHSVVITLNFINQDGPESNPNKVAVRPDPVRNWPEAIAAGTAARIKSRRMGLGWSQRHLAGELSIIGFTLDPSAVTRVESGDRSVKAEELWALAHVFGCTVEDLCPSSLSPGDFCPGTEQS